ncbi:MAG: hypothetical protein V1659_02910 [Candidatus Woesearchaeota archaeon]
MEELPEDWNKQFHFVKIRPIPKKFAEKLFPKEELVGHIWPTNNWVEVHCFEKKEIKCEFTVCEQNCTVNIETETNTTPHQMMKLFESVNTYFHNRKKSFIISRKKVFFGSSNIIYCDPSKEDIGRWKEWHPDNKYLTFFEGNEKEWYFGETHQGELFVQKIEGKSLGPMEHIDENFLRF